MAQCVKCGKKGLFLRVNIEGLCRNCAKKSNYKIKIDDINELKKTPETILRELEDLRPNVDLQGDMLLKADYNNKVFCLYEKNYNALWDFEKNESYSNQQLKSKVKVPYSKPPLFYFNDIAGIRVIHKSKEIAKFGNPVDSTISVYLTPDEEVNSDSIFVLITIRSYLDATFEFHFFNSKKEWDYYIGSLSKMIGIECPAYPDSVAIPPTRFVAQSNNIKQYNDVKNQQFSIDDILSLNFYLEESAQYGAADIYILKSDIDFNKTRIIHNPPTPSGRIPKFPKYLFFTTINVAEPRGAIWNGNVGTPVITDGVMGKIFYNQRDEIGRIELTIWKNNHCYIVKYTEKNKELILTAIDTLNTDGTKMKVFRQSNSA